MFDRPVVTPLYVTGAALRAVQAADRVAADVWDRYEGVKAQVLSMSYALTDAVSCMNAVTTCLRLQEATKEVLALVPRWQAGCYNEYWGNTVLKGTTLFGATVYAGNSERVYLSQVITHAFQQHVSNLIKAGVPMAETPKALADWYGYWEDAAARGC